MFCYSRDWISNKVDKHIRKLIRCEMTFFKFVFSQFELALYNSELLVLMGQCNIVGKEKWILLLSGLCYSTNEFSDSIFWQREVGLVFLFSFLFLGETYGGLQFSELFLVLFGLICVKKMR